MGAVDGNGEVELMGSNILDIELLAFKDADVYIVGTGPNGKEYHWRVPNGALVIALNKALRIWRIPKQYWLCSAPGLLNEDWFEAEALWVCNKNPAYKAVFLQGPLTDTYPDVPLYMPEGLSFHQGPMTVVDGLIRRGAGSCGCALQLAYQKQAKRCVLIGIDMKGKGYWDGTVNENKRSIHPNGVWTQLPMLQKLVDWCKAHGMDVVSMSETELKVEVI